MKGEREGEIQHLCKTSSSVVSEEGKYGHKVKTVSFCHFSNWSCFGWSPCQVKFCLRDRQKKLWQELTVAENSTVLMPRTARNMRLFRETFPGDVV